MRHLPRRAAVLGLAAAAALAVASPASAGPDKSAGTLSIDGVGSSPILSWAWGIENQTSIGSGSGGAGSGKVQLEDFTLTKRINPFSTDLMRAVALGQHFSEVLVSVPIGGPGTPFAIRYRLRTVFVESLKQAGSAGEATETVTLVYGAVDQDIGNAASEFGFADGG